MTTQSTKKSTIITTFTGDIYIISDKTPDDIADIAKTVEFLRMPNGSRIHAKSISMMQSYEDYTFQTEQKMRHKKGQFLKSGGWHDNQGSLGIGAELQRITGSLLQIETPKHKELTTA